jgi:hypothetical protein
VKSARASIASDRNGEQYFVYFFYCTSFGIGNPERLSASSGRARRLLTVAVENLPVRADRESRRPV